MVCHVVDSLPVRGGRETPCGVTERTDYLKLQMRPNASSWLHSATNICYTESITDSFLVTKGVPNANIARTQRT